MNIRGFELQLFQKVKTVEKFNFYEYLAVMLNGGVSITEALNSVQSKISNTFFKEKIQELAMFVNSGDSFSKSMKKIPHIFSPGEIAMIESGETTGKLSMSLARLSENLRKSHDLRAKIKSAMTYPMIIFLFLILAVIIVLAYVIPAVSQLFETTDTELPFATLALISASDFVINRWYMLLFFAVSCVLLFIGYKNTDSGRASIDHMLLTLPLIGKVRKNYLLAMFATNFGVLLSSGVSVIKSLDLSAKSLEDAVYDTYIQEVIQKVSGGQKIVESMGEVDDENILFPLDFLQLLSVGEKTASMDTVTKTIVDQYTREVDYSLANMTKWIEPIAILVAGLFVLWFAFAIFGAILKITQAVG